MENGPFRESMVALVKLIEAPTSRLGEHTIWESKRCREPHGPYSAVVNNHAMMIAPARMAKRSNTPAAMAHIGERLVAHHMNREARSAHTPAATITISCEHLITTRHSSQALS